VIVTLTDAEFARAWVAAEFQHQTVGQWISGLVNDSLSP
jgi:hypothetical protein